MREVAASEAGREIETLLEWVEAGEEVAILRSGKVVARLLPPTAAHVDRVQDAIAGIRAMRKGATLGASEIKDLIAEGRR